MEIFLKLNRNRRWTQIWKQKQFNYKNSKKVKKTPTSKAAPEATTRTRKKKTAILEARESNASNSEIDICKLSINCNRVLSMLDILTN